MLPTTERFFRAGAPQPFAFQSILHSNFVADIVRSGQISEARHSNALASVRNLFLDVQQAGGDLGGEIPLRLQSSSNLIQWATLPNLPEVGANGAFFTLEVPTNHASFHRAVIALP